VTDGELNTTAAALLNVANVAPIFDSLEVVPGDEGAPVEVTVNFHDPGWLDTHVVRIDWEHGPPTMPTVRTTVTPPVVFGTATAVHVYGDNGIFIGTIQVEDDDAGLTTHKRNLVVGNLDPSIDGLDVTMTVNRPRTQGYWSHQCRFETPPSPEHVGIQPGFITAIAADSDVFSSVSSKEEVCAQLEKTDMSDMLWKAKLQLMALWLNVVSGFLSEHSPINLTLTDASTVGEAIREIESVILAGGPADEMERVKDIADALNNGQGISLAAVSIGGTVSDPGSDDLTVFADFGDATASSITYFNDGVGPDPAKSPGGTFPFTVAVGLGHGYWTAGTYTILVTLSDDDGASLNAAFAFTIG
jgi:hypothetical protein